MFMLLYMYFLLEVLSGGGGENSSDIKGCQNKLLVFKGEGGW